MGVVMAYHNRPIVSLKAKLGGELVAAVLLILILMQAITVLGVGICSQQLYPLFRLAQMIKVGDFFERMEALEVFFWVGGGFVSVTVLYYCSALGAAQLLKLKDFRYLTPVVGVAMLALSLLMFQDVTERWTFLAMVFPYPSLGVEALLPTLLLVVSLIRHHHVIKGKNNRC